MSDIGDWYKSIPLITRSWFTASVAFPLIGVLRLVDIRNLLLFPELVISRFHVSYHCLCSALCDAEVDTLCGCCVFDVVG